MSNNYSPETERQIARLTGYCTNGTTAPNLDTTTKYWSQRDNDEQPHRTCNSTSNAMYLDWLLRVTGRPGLRDDQPYVNTVMGIGDTTEHWVQTEAIRKHGFSTAWETDRDTAFVKELLEVGIPVVVNILHRGTLANPTGGHVILLVGHSGGSFVAHDPYGTLASNYSNFNGKHSTISDSTFAKRWQGGYRVLAA